MSIKRHFINFKLSNESDKIDTIIGESVVLDGPLTSKQSIRVDGVINGSISTKSNVFIGPDSTINGDVKGKEVTVCGKVNGNVTAKGRIILTAKAQITGNMVMQHLVMDEGAVFNGNCSMQSSSSPEKEK